MFATKERARPCNALFLVSSFALSKRNVPSSFFLIEIVSGRSILN